MGVERFAEGVGEGEEGVGREKVERREFNSKWGYLGITGHECIAEVGHLSNLLLLVNVVCSIDELVAKVHHSSIEHLYPLLLVY